MYIVRFVRVDGQPNEEFFYCKEEDAMCHLGLFEEDNSQLYALIEVVMTYKNREQQLVKLLPNY